MQQDIELLRARAVEQLCDAFLAHDLTFPGPCAQLDRVIIGSDYALAQMRRYPSIAKALMSTSPLAAQELDAHRQALSEQLAECADEAAVMATLRQYRHRALVRIIWRDLNGLADIQTILAEQSDLAQALIEAAMSWALSARTARHGQAVDAQGRALSLLTLGMGKLGGRELNFSSDIDLIFFFAEDGHTDGPRSIENAVFFTRVGQTLIRLLNDVTADGFVYRVDMRLRPFGKSGPLAMSFDAAEQYYLTQGREWERYAMLKARAITGAPADIEAIEQLLRPFIYRRYLDYGVLESLRDLKAKINAELAQRSNQGNIKLGRGGIRSIEFITQSFQLVRGGRDRQLQCPELYRVLNYAAESGLLDPKIAQALLDHYGYFRRLENRVQMLDDQQTHAIPEEPLSAARVAQMMDVADVSTLRECLSQRQAFVQAEFDRLLRAEGDEPESSWDALGALWHAQTPVDELEAFFAQQGMSDSASLAHSLLEWRGSKNYAALSARAQTRIEKALPQVMSAAMLAPSSALAAVRLMALLRAIAGRSVYVQVLIEHPAALERLARLFVLSPWIFEFVCQHPIVIDELLKFDVMTAQSAQGLHNSAADILSAVERADLELRMDRLRQFKQAQTLRCAMLDLDQRLDLMQISDQLTWTAEAILQVAMLEAIEGVAQRHGHLRDELGQLAPPLLVVAYGKLGGIELGYSSDLDIVLLYEKPTGHWLSDGKKPLDATIWYARVAQKLIHFLTTYTTAGTLYEVDTRLRPNGQSGPLVVDLEAYRRYLLHDAWTWELQALVRARAVTGAAKSRALFAQIREQALGASRDACALRTEVVDMRARMRRELTKGSPHEFDLKQGCGGVTDIEFLVQFLVLRWSHRHPNLLIYSDNVRLLVQLAQEGLLDQHRATQLHAAYVHLRNVGHRLALQGRPALIEADACIRALCDDVSIIWQALMDPPTTD